MEERNDLMKINSDVVAESPTSVAHEEEPVDVIDHLDQSEYERLPRGGNRRNRISFTTLLALKENHWANFFGGIVTTLIPILILPSVGQRYSGMKEGLMSSLL